MWRLYLAEKSFETSLEFCHSVSQRDTVLTAQAEHFFEKGDFERAANIFAQTFKSFEEVGIALWSERLCYNNISHCIVVRKFRNSQSVNYHFEAPQCDSRLSHLLLTLNALTRHCCGLDASLQVVLLFVNTNERAALKTFLMKKLETFRPSAKSQRMVLCTWLTEIQLEALNRCTQKTLVEKVSCKPAKLLVGFSCCLCCSLQHPLLSCRLL